MKDQPLPPELARRWGNLPDLVYRGGDEWSAACPQCGGTGGRGDRSDRFRLFGGDKPRAWCRQCGHFAFADDDQQRPSPEAIEAATRERVRLAEQERQRIRGKIEALQHAAYWQGWHDAMSQQHRELWLKEGVVEWAIDYYRLGYCADYTTRYQGQEWHTPTMTIPHWGGGWQLTNIQHRLLNPPEPGDKYRQTAGLPAAMFRTEPDEALNRAVLVVEGAKKAIVTYLHLGGTEAAVVGLPSKTPSAEMLDALAQCEPVYLALDPDAYAAHGKMPPAVNRIVKRLDPARVRLVRLPCKPDDLFTSHRGTAADFRRYLKLARGIA